jgi:arylformamidase
MKRKIVDMTWPMHEGMLTPDAPWHPRVEITQLGRHCYEGRESYKITFGTHTGTHIDTPAHMVPDGEPRIDKIPLEKLIGRAKLLDIPKEAYTGGEITIQDIENTGVKIEKGDRLILRTGWGKYWLTQTFYDGDARPFFEPETADWLCEKGITLIGMDMSGPDNRSKVALKPGVPSPVHWSFLSRGVFIVEYLANLEQITVPEFDLYCLPWKVKDMDGCPVRCVAIFDEK